MNWFIGKTITNSVLNGVKAEYGRKVVIELSAELTNRLGKGFDKSSLFRMTKFYKDFPDFQIVATLSQQLSWSHFVELLSINDSTKREFYAVLCCNEGWNIRTLRERKKSMLFERTALSRQPKETIKKELSELRFSKKMSIDLFIKDPYVLDFLNL